MILGSNIYNVGQFFYHFIAGRFLGKAYYGDLAAIISILGIIGILQVGIGLTITKFIASEIDNRKIDGFINWIFRWSIWIGFIFAILLIFISPLIIRFLNLSQASAVYPLGPLIFFFVVITSGRAILQGLLKFHQYVYSLLSESIVKILLTILFILLGYAVFGSLLAILIGFIVSFFLTKSFLSSYLKKKGYSEFKLSTLAKFSFAAAIQSLALNSMYSLDLVLVKHFFSPEEAGIYASLAIMGRVVFFAATPITQVMFPMVAKKYKSKEEYKNVLYLSFAIISAICIILTMFYYLFPNFAITLLYGKGFLEGASLLWWYAVFMSLLALATLLTQFYLSVSKTRIVLIFAIAAILQIILIWFVHPNLVTIIQISIALATLLVISLLIYFPYHLK